MKGGDFNRINYMTSFLFSLMIFAFCLRSSACDLNCPVVQLSRPLPRHVCIHCICIKEQSHEIVRLPNRTICEKSCGCKTSLQFYLRFVGVAYAYLRSRIGSN